jgi:hypothetical protein
MIFHPHLRSMSHCPTLLSSDLPEQVLGAPLEPTLPHARTQGEGDMLRIP